jgi:osomolarity two-component system sensor histidine kinase CHK1
MLTDYSLTSRLQREDVNIMDAQGTRRSLAYIPPEGTGRVNKSVDYRADFYSLGVVCYEVLYLTALTKLFVGFLPFRSTDPLDMIHQHVTKTPTPPHELNPMIPVAVSDVIMKLMAKNAEDRYQSPDAIKADLRFIRDRYENGSSLEGFILGHTDDNSRFLIPEKLYGREEELATLYSAFESIKVNGGSAMITVSGISGVGKSRLVHELQRPVMEARGRFTSGKFDQNRRGIPFYALIQALQDLVRQVLSESESKLDEFCEKVNEALGSDANILLDVIPEVAMLLPAEPPSTVQMPVMGSMEREERFKTVLVKFLRIFAPKGKPLVIFLVHPKLY